METDISLPALLAFHLLMDSCKSSATLLQESSELYGQVDVMQASELASLVSYATQRLELVRRTCCKPIRLIVSKDLSIHLEDDPGTCRRELKLRPMLRCLFLLFLRHPEGIAFKSLPDYKTELLEIYLRISGRGDMNSINASIDRLVNSCDNYINVNRSMIASSLKPYFEESLLHMYTINGKAGERMTIELDRAYVRWE